MSSGLDDFAKTLRKRSTDTENLLWKHLRAKRLMGLKFRRQEPIGKYIVDFICYERRVIIEADGGQHSEEREKDQEGDRWFRSEGFKVLRFWNNEVLSQTEEMLEIIAKKCLETPSPSSPPSRDCVVIAIYHCERPQGARQSPFFSTHYEIASIASLSRNDIATQSLKGGDIKTKI